MTDTDPQDELFESSLQAQMKRILRVDWLSDLFRDSDHFFFFLIIYVYHPTN